MEGKPFDEWPDGRDGDLLVVAWDRLTQTSHMIPVATEDEAKAKFHEARNFPDIWSVVLESGANQGLRSPVVCVKRYDQIESKWITVLDTEGHDQEVRKWDEE